MMWLFYLMLMILMVLTYFLFAPIYIEVDSERGLFRLRLHRLASVRLFLRESIFMELRITWWHKYFDLLAARNRKTKPSRKKVREKSAIPFQKISAVIGTFKIRKCEINIDSGDNYLNGIFFPWVLLLGMCVRKNIGMNFLGENKLILEIKSNVARVLWAFIK